MIEWTASAGRIHANGEVFNIKGANWFGTEGQHAMLYGLEKHGYTPRRKWCMLRCSPACGDSPRENHPMNPYLF